MISIAIDDKACVSCTLCEEICPTDVFKFDDAKGVPEVVRPAECFGCLSCSEICPSQCITHSDLTISQDHYHDPYAVHLAGRLGADLTGRMTFTVDEADRKAALEDLGVRLRAVAEVFTRTLGGSLPAVGTMAGRTLAKHLPRYRSARDLGEALEMAKAEFAPAWQMETDLAGDQLTVKVGRCFVREICQRDGLELGGPLCVLFYNYLAGYVGRTGQIRLKLENADRGDSQCTYTVKAIPS
jgi:NAD-dependent dihydropyrimidine dehydrogenase PreA subunit